MKNLVQMTRFPAGLGLRKKDGVSQFDAGANEWCSHSSTAGQKFIIDT